MDTSASRVVRLDAEEEEEDEGNMMVEITTPESLESITSSCEEIAIVLGKDSDLQGLVNVMQKNRRISTAWSIELSSPPEMGVPDWTEEPAKLLFESLLQCYPKLSSLSISNFHGLPLFLLQHMLLPPTSPQTSGFCLETLDMELATVTFDNTTTFQTQQQQQQLSSSATVAKKPPLVTTQSSLKHLSLSLSGNPAEVDWDSIVEALSTMFDSTSTTTTLSSVTVYAGRRSHMFRRRRHLFRQQQQQQQRQRRFGGGNPAAIAQFREERKAQFDRIRKLQNGFFQALGSLPTRELFLHQLPRHKGMSLGSLITSLQSNCHVRELHLEWCIPLVEFILPDLIQLLDTTSTTPKAADEQDHDDTTTTTSTTTTRKNKLQILRLLQLKETPLEDTLIQLARALTNNTTLKELHCVTKQVPTRTPPREVNVVNNDDDDEEEDDDGVQEDSVISIGASIAFEKLLQKNHHLKVLNFGDLRHSPTVRFLLAVNTVRDANASIREQKKKMTKDQRTVHLLTACANMKDDDYDFHLSGLFYFVRRNPSHIVSARGVVGGGSSSSSSLTAFSNPSSSSRKRKLSE